jgi:hypothetical protein
VAGPIGDGGLIYLKHLYLSDRPVTAALDCRRRKSSKFYKSGKSYVFKLLAKWVNSCSC